MKTTVALLILGILPIAQAQDAAAVVVEKVYAEFTVPDVPPLATPARQAQYARNLPPAPVSALPKLPEDYSNNLQVAPVSAPQMLPEDYCGKLQVMAAVTPLDTFRRKLLFSWVSPYGEAMTTLLKEIDATEKAGDTETYNRLTGTYTVWADEYLLRGAQFENKQTP